MPRQSRLPEALLEVHWPLHFELYFDVVAELYKILQNLTYLQKSVSKILVTKEYYKHDGAIHCSYVNPPIQATAASLRWYPGVPVTLVYAGEGFAIVYGDRGNAEPALLQSCCGFYMRCTVSPRLELITQSRRPLPRKSFAALRWCVPEDIQIRSEHGTPPQSNAPGRSRSTDLTR